MRFESGPAPSLGLLHILEDALSLLEGHHLTPDRRAFVLKESKELIGEAQEGSSISRNDGVFVPPGKWRALKSFSLLNRYLGTQRQQLDENSLQEVAVSLARLSNGEAVSEDVRENAITTLRDVCEQMSRDVSIRNIGSNEDLPAIAL
jgi:hypothetical protein